MKIFLNILTVIAVGLIIFNMTMVSVSAPLEGQSGVALIGIVASTCALLLLTIFRISKKIEEKTKG